MRSIRHFIRRPTGAALQIATEDIGALFERSLAEIVVQAERMLKLSPEDWGKMSAAAIVTARRCDRSEAISELAAAFYGALGE